MPENHLIEIRPGLYEVITQRVPCDPYDAIDPAPYGYLKGSQREQDRQRAKQLEREAHESWQSRSSTSS